MKTRFLFSAILAVAIATACSPERTAVQDTLRAEIETLSTRTSLEAVAGGYQVNWVAGDRIVLTDGTGKAVYQTDAGGSTVADFVKVEGPDLTGDTMHAWYPEEFADGVLPAVQVYDPVRVVVPMVSEATSSVAVLKFTPVAGVLRLDVSTAEAGVKVREIRVLDDRELNLRLDCGEGVAVGGEPVPFYLSVPAGTYRGMRIIVRDTRGLVCAAELEKGTVFTVNRAELRAIPIASECFQPYEGSGEATLMYGPDFNEMIKQLATPDRKAVDNDSTITHIVFKTGDFTEGQVLVSDFRSENPVWASFDGTTGTVTITSPARVLYTDAQASHMFRGFCLVQEIGNLKVLNTSRAENLSYFFHRCFNLKSVDLSGFDTSNCNCFGFMFSYCQALESLDVSHFNTAKAVTMANMFQFCQTLTELDVSGFVTDSVRSMDNIFSDCHKIKSLDLSAWNTDNVTDTRSMFNRCKSIKELDIRHMTFPNTGRMTYMFYEMENLEVLHIDGMDCSRWTAVDNHVHMFRHIPHLREVFFGEKGYNTSSFKPGNFWTPSNDGDGVRTASLSGSLTIHCCEAAVAWLSATNLRWVNSGYKGKTAIPVKFVDYLTGEELPVSWPAN